MGERQREAERGRERLRERDGERHRERDRGMERDRLRKAEGGRVINSAVSGIRERENKKRKKEWRGFQESERVQCQQS